MASLYTGNALKVGGSRAVKNLCTVISSPGSADVGVLQLPLKVLTSTVKAPLPSLPLTPSEHEEAERTETCRPLLAHNDITRQQIGTCQGC